MDNTVVSVKHETDSVQLLENWKKNQDHEFISKVSKYLEQKGYPLDDVVQVHWCGPNHSISSIAGKEHRNNPSDILLEYTDGRFYGISLKHTTRPDRITLKNPGLGTIGRYLGFDYKNIENIYHDQINSLFELPSNRSKRKTAIRNNPGLRTHIDAQGDSLIHLIANSDKFGVASLYNKKSIHENKKHFLEDWFSISSRDIPYVALIRQNNEHTIEDYKGDSRIKLLKSCKTLSVTPNGLYLVVSADSIDILRMRIKFESQKLASSIKFNGELLP